MVLLSRADLFQFAYADSSTHYGWANAILCHDVEEQAIVLVLMNTISQATTAFTFLLAYPTVGASCPGLARVSSWICFLTD